MNNAHLPAPASNGSSGADGGPESESRLSQRRTPVEERYAPGSIFAGKYRIVRLLGEGGMGAVWRAHSLSLDVDVAIKVLHRDQIPRDASARLLREARATASIGHPSIVQMFDFGETEAGEPFLIMELLEGDSLAGWIDERGRISATLAVQMLLPIADALVAAHERGIIHRDIKPENIIAVPSGPGSYLPKIVDFGVAKLLSSHHVGHVLTETGMILGSLEYMSPEQAEGQLEVGEQTDVWALCVVLYELITGTRPFQGATASATIFALYTRDPVPITELAAGDDELWDILRRGLEKSPAKRWSTMRALGRALAFWAIERGITVDTAETSLVHHWSVPVPPLPISAERTMAISKVPAGAPRTSPLALSIDAPAGHEPWARAAQLPPAPRLGTIELGRPGLDPPIRASLPDVVPHAKWLAALVALVVLLVAIITGLGLRLATGPLPLLAGAPSAAIVVASAGPTPPSTRSSAGVDQAPAPAPTDSIALVEARPEASAKVGRAREPSGAPKARKAGMPLPPLPNY